MTWVNVGGAVSGGSTVTSPYASEAELAAVRIPLATGSTTARSLADRFADVVNVKDFGVKGDGVTDDTAALQAAANGGRRLYIPDAASSQFYKVTADVVLKQDMHLVGQSKASTIVKFFGCNGFTAANTVSGTYDISLENMTIAGNGLSTTKHGILLNGDGGVNVGRVRLEDLVVQGFSGDGIYINRPILTQLRNIQSQNNGRYGFDLIGDGTSVTVLGCYATGNGSDGFHIENNLNYSFFGGCAADSNTGAGYNFNAAIATPAVGIALSGCGSESNTGDHFKFTATQGLALSGLYVFPGSPAVGGHFLNLNGVRHCSLSGIFMPQAAPAGKFALFLDSVGGTQFPTNIIGKGVSFSSVQNNNDAYRDLSVDVAPGTSARAIQSSRIYMGTAAPIAGTFNLGDRVVNSSPSVGQPKAWACTVAGTPGTWVSEGNL